MLAFIDESGHPHPNDSATRPVALAVCISERDSRFIGGRLHALKRDLLGKEQMEIKAQKLLNRNTFRRIPEKREFVEAFFDLVRNLPLTIFAIIMERPHSVIPESSIYLPNQFRYLLQRIDLLSQERNEMATILFDGDGHQYGGLSTKFNSFLHRSAEGRSLQTITDAPFFVDSKITAGIQIADMGSGVVRLYQENELFRTRLMKDAFLSAIGRYYQIIEEKTRDQSSEDGFPRKGLYLMPERDHYAEEYTEKPENQI